MLDTSQLTKASTKSGLRWRDTGLTFIWVREDGPIVSAHKIADKLSMIEECGADDCVLAVRQVQYPTRQQVLVIDQFDVVRRALSDTP
jgi:hypothetical protein